MKITKTFYTADRKTWRAWLSKNHAKEKEIWLIYYKVASGKKRIPYNDAVEEALCFGWIDSIAKSLDYESYVQRYSPRRKDSVLSHLNKERIKQMIAQKKMTTAGLTAVAHAFDANEKFVVAPDILAAIKKDKLAWAHYQKLPERYQRIRIAYVEEVRDYSREMFEKRLAHFIRKTAKNKRFGFVRD